MHSTNDSKNNIKSVVFVNTPIEDTGKDAIGIQPTIDSIESAIDDGAKMIGVIAGYGTGKSSLINAIKEKHSKKNIIHVNMWSDIKIKEDEDKVSNLTKTFLYQVAMGIDDNLAKYINRLLSNNYRVLSFTIENMIIIRCLIYICVLYWSAQNSKNQIPLYSAAIVVGFIVIVFGLYSSGVLYSFWKNESDRSVDSNEMFEAYNILRKKLKNKETYIVIDDLDRVGDIDRINEFLKELYRFNCMSIDNNKKIKKKIVYFILIKPETEIYKISKESNKENNKIPNLYNKFFDYIIRLKPIHFEDAKTVLLNIINSEAEKKEYLFEKILHEEKNTEELPDSFDWLCKGNGLTIRELKDRVNKAIQLYVDIINKTYTDSPVLKFETCVAVVYLENTYSHVFFELIKHEDKLSYIIQESIKKIDINKSDLLKDISNLIKEQIKNENVSEEKNNNSNENMSNDLALMIINGVIDADYRMYFYSFPKGSYVRNIYEKDLTNYIEMPNQYSYDEKSVKDTVAKVIEKGSFDNIQKHVNKISARDNVLFPRVLFYDKNLILSMIETTNIDKIINSLIYLASWKNIDETITIIKNTLLCYPADDLFFWAEYNNGLIKTIFEKKEDYSLEKIIKIRTTLIELFNDRVTIYHNLFVQDDTISILIPIITAQELSLINNKNVAMQLIDVDRLEDKNFREIYEVLWVEKLKYEELDKAIEIVQGYLSKQTGFDIAKEVCNFLTINFIIDEVFLDFIKSAYVNGNLEKEQFCRYINTVYEQLDDEMLDVVNDVGIFDSYDIKVIDKLWNAGLYLVPIKYHFNMGTLREINYDVYGFDEDIFVDVCKSINKEKQQIIIDLRKANLAEKRIIDDLYFDVFPFITQDELTLFESFQYAIRCVNASNFNTDNIDIIIDFINTEKRMGDDCSIIFDYLFNYKKYSDGVCTNKNLAKTFCDKLDYSKVLFSGLSDEDCESIVSYISQLIDLDNNENAIRFMEDTNRLIPSLEKMICFDEQRYIDLVNKIDNISNDTIGIITDNKYYAGYNEKINKSLYNVDKKMYIASVVLGKKGLEYPIDNVSFKDVYEHYNINSPIFKYLEINNDFLQDCIDNAVYMSFDDKTNWRLVTPLSNAQQTVGFFEYILKNRADNEIISYLTSLNSIKTEKDSIEICGLLKRNNFMRYLENDKTFKHVSYRLWENHVSRGYKGALTRARNKWLNEHKTLALN